MTAWLRRHWVALVATAGATVAAVVAPTQQDARHFDHIGFESAIRRAKAGDGLYRAMVDGLAEMGSTVTQARSVRQVGILGVWMLIPTDLLQPAFFFVVCLGSVLCAIPMLRHQWVALFIGAWLAEAGVFHGVDAWLLFELWAVPLVLGCALAHLKGRDGLAATLALGAVLIRETAVLLPIGMLLAARAQGRSIRPWLLSLGAAAAGYGLHLYWARNYLSAEGNEAALVGTGAFDAVAHMTSFLVVPAGIGLVIWTVGLVRLWNSALRGAVGLAAMPLTGLLVARPYWGFLAMPLCLLALGGLPPWPPDQPATRREAPSVVST